MQWTFWSTQYYRPILTYPPFTRVYPVMQRGLVGCLAAIWVHHTLLSFYDLVSWLCQKKGNCGLCTCNCQVGVWICDTGWFIKVEWQRGKRMSPGSLIICELTLALNYQFILSGNKLWKTGMSNLLASLGHTLNTQTLTKTDEQRKGFKWIYSFVLGRIHCHRKPWVGWVSNLQPVGCMQPSMAVNAAPHKIVNVLKTLWDFLCDYVSQCI